MKKLITIGKITRNQGNKGEVRIIPFTDFPERFQVLKRVYLVKDEEKTIWEIESVRQQNKFIVAKFKGIENIEQAIGLKEYHIKIPEEELVPLTEGEYYLYQLIDSAVYTNSGDYLGQVDDILTTGGADILMVENEDDSYMIPFVKDYVINVDQVEKEITIKPIRGLLDL